MLFSFGKRGPLHLSSNRNQLLMKLSNPLNTKNVPLYELNVSFFLSTVSFGLIILYALARMGFDNSYYHFSSVLGINFFLLFTPLVVQLIAPRTETVGRSGLLTLASICLVVLVSFIVPYVGHWISAILVFAGYIFFVLALLVFLRSNKFGALLILFFLQACLVSGYSEGSIAVIIVH